MLKWNLSKATEGSGIGMIVELKSISAVGNYLAPFLALDLNFSKTITGDIVGNSHIPLSKILAQVTDFFGS